MDVTNSNGVYAFFHNQKQVRGSSATCYEAFIKIQQLFYADVYPKQGTTLQKYI